jgi:hypothetical protein
MKYKAYPKQAIIAAMRRRMRLSGAPAKFVPTKAPSILDFSKWPQWWEAGAKELEKTAPGQLITAPVRIPAAVVSSTKKTVEAVPTAVRGVSYALPFIAIAAVLIGGGYYADKAGLFDKLKSRALIKRVD